MSTPTPDVSLREKAERATRGPWAVEVSENPMNDAGRAMWPGGVSEPERTVATAWNHPQVHGAVPIFGVGTSPYRERAHAVWIQPEDADFIAACDPQTVLDLLSRVERAEADSKEHWEAIDDACSEMREPMTLADAREARQVLTRYVVERKKRLARERQAASPDILDRLRDALAPLAATPQPEESTRE